MEARGLGAGVRRSLRRQWSRNGVGPSIAGSRTHPDHSARPAAEIVHLGGVADDDRTSVGGAMRARRRQRRRGQHRARSSSRHAASDFSDGSFGSGRRSFHSCWQRRQRKITVVTPAEAITPTAIPTPVWQLRQEGVSEGSAFSILSDPVSLERRILPAPQRERT